MKSYFCYVHTASSMTPQLRVLAAEDTDSFIEQMQLLLDEWPSFDLVDVYDRTDQLVLRMAYDGKPTLC